MPQRTKVRQLNNPTPPVAPRVVIKTTDGTTSTKNRSIDNPLHSVVRTVLSILDTWYHMILSDFVVSRFWNPTWIYWPRGVNASGCLELIINLKLWLVSTRSLMLRRGNIYPKRWSLSRSRKPQVIKMDLIPNLFLFTKSAQSFFSRYVRAGISAKFYY